jgi:hypothetical protein
MLGICRAKGWEMRKVASAEGVSLDSTSAIRGGAFAEDPGLAKILTFDLMTPVAGPYIGSANAIRGIPGGGLPWMLRSSNGSLSREGRLRVRVRGLVLASKPAVPENLRGTNPFPAFRAIVSCLTTATGDNAALTNISTGEFEASAAGDWSIDARVSLPEPCIAPIVLVIGPSGVESWLAVTGG